MSRNTYVVVTLGIGTVQHGYAVADQFESGVLTITGALEEPDRVVATYTPDRWLEVSVYGADDYPLYGWQNPQRAQVEQRVREGLEMARRIHRELDAEQARTQRKAS